MLRCSTGRPGTRLSPGLASTRREGEGGGKIAFHGFREIIEFKSPVYNSSCSRRILSIYLRSRLQPSFLAPHHPRLTMTDYNIAPRLPRGVVAIPHNGRCQVQQSRPGTVHSVQGGAEAKKKSPVCSGRTFVWPRIRVEGNGRTMKLYLLMYLWMGIKRPPADISYFC